MMDERGKSMRGCGGVVSPTLLHNNDPRQDRTCTYVILPWRGAKQTVTITNIGGGISLSSATWDLNLMLSLYEGPSNSYSV